MCSPFFIIMEFAGVKNLYRRNVQKQFPDEKKCPADCENEKRNYYAGVKRYII